MTTEPLRSRGPRPAPADDTAWAGATPFEVPLPSSTSGARIRLLGYPAIDAAWADDLPSHCETYAEALAMPVAEPEEGSKRLAGAIYTAEGQLIEDSERGKTNRVWRGNPGQLPDLPAAKNRIDGRTFFAGHYRNSFGHILLELLPRFWPDLDFGRYDTLLFYPQRAGRRTTRLQPPQHELDLLGAATGGSLPRLRIVAGKALRLEEVTVSSPGFWLKRGFSPAVRSVFGRVAANLARDAASAAGEQPRRIYLSRSHLSGRDRRADNEAEIEEVVATAGFTVVHPQELPVAEQVALVRGADIIAGCDGSALHLGVFAQPGSRLISFDSRPVPNQFLVDHLGGLDAVHALCAVGAEDFRRTGSWQADLALVRAALDLAG